MIETWKHITDYEGLYEISDHGMVRNKLNKIISTQLNNSGYKIVHLYKNNKRKAFTIHRLVAIAFVPNEHSKSQVDHINCNKLDNHYNNLRWFTSLENMQHASSSGMLDNAAKGAKKRMVSVGQKYGFDNSQKNLIKAKPVTLKIDSENKSFRSTRQASMFLGIDHKTLTRRLKQGLYQ